MNERLVELHNQARECYFADEFLDRPRNQVERLILTKFAKLVAADEREACAKLCDERERANLYGVKECAAAIRGRTK